MLTHPEPAPSQRVGGSVYSQIRILYLCSFEDVVVFKHLVQFIFWWFSFSLNGSSKSFITVFWKSQIMKIYGRVYYVFLYSLCKVVCMFTTCSKDTRGVATLQVWWGGETQLYGLCKEE